MTLLSHHLQPSTSSSDEGTQTPQIFGSIIADRLDDLLNYQKPDGSIEVKPGAPKVYPQQSILPMAFCWAGLDPAGKWKQDPRLENAIRKLGDFLTGWFDDSGQISFDSYGYPFVGVDQRLTYAWLEALRILREAGGDFPFEAWGKKIAAACEYLIEHRLRKLQGVRRFLVRIMGTSTNHVMLYVATLYRAGVVLGRQDFVDFILPIGRAIAADMHPDGYWDEHSDLLRTGGPTPSYNYLTLAGIGLMARWTGEAVFQKAMDRGAKFHSDFSYPDGMFLDLIDERVRCDVSPRAINSMYDAPRMWGLYAFSSTPEGRAVAERHLKGWLAATPTTKPVSPETLARFVENYLYWESGPIGTPPTDRPHHRAKLTLPASLNREGPWCIGLSTIRAVSAEDDAYRDNPFALERQKLFSVWHERAGLIIDGSHSKHQPENSTFAAAGGQTCDYFPCGGEVGEENGEFVARAAYKTFFGAARVKPIDDNTLRITLEIDPAATQGPFTAAFTLRMLDRKVVGLDGKTTALADEPFVMTGAELGGGFLLGNITITGPTNFQLNWPLSPFNSYAANNKALPNAWIPRVSVELTPKNPKAEFVLKVK